MTMPAPKTMSANEIFRISEEWADSKVVSDLLGHIQALNQVIVDQAGKIAEPEADNHG